MAVKTITIDLEAYTLLSRHKQDGQSFSEVIKAHFGPQPTAGAFRTLVRGLRIGEDALDGMERQVSERRLDRARAVKR
jgi:predicted CopG family antitoxin